VRLLQTAGEGIQGDEEEVMKEMRRKDREITGRREIDEVIKKSTVMHLAMADGNVPYVVPLSFGYDGRNIYFHSAKEGLKLDFIRKNPEVCFAFSADVAYKMDKLSCKSTVSFKSVIGRGKCSFLEDTKEKKEGLDIIMKQYSGEVPQYDPVMLEKTTVVKIEVKELSGKNK
jgi:nitroimidazol reductase NimA-like FMN-containing flavoprotein (pyridoxamine 5'-phosphate oxidase superfamily)